MVSISPSRLNSILASMLGKRIAVIGDLMLDRYMWGSVSRISPEAPVPVIDLEKEQLRLGGAANVAKNVKSLGGEPLLIGVIGADNSGRQLSEIVSESGFGTEGIVVDETRPTTVKTRVIAHQQHVVRIDRESKSDIPAAVLERATGVLRSHIDKIDGIILEDYNKGVIVKDLISRVIELANRHGKIVTVDPKFNNFFEYRNVTVFKPNRKEAEEVMGVRLRTREDIDAAGQSLLKKLGAANILMTLGAEGMSLFESDGSISHVPTKARNVADVSGAGDTVISTLTAALCGGAGIREASLLANFAGGIVCGYVGIVPIDRDELRRTVLEDMDHQVGQGG